MEVLAILAGLLGVVITSGVTLFLGLRKLRQENATQHAEGRDLVTLVSTTLDRVGERVDEIHGEVHGLQTWRATHTEYHRLTDPPVPSGVGHGCPDDPTPRSA